MDSSYNFEDCIGLKIKPLKGDGLLFYSLFPNGTIDPVSIFILDMFDTITFLTRLLGNTNE